MRACWILFNSIFDVGLLDLSLSFDVGLLDLSFLVCFGTSGGHWCHGDRFLVDFGTSVAA